MFFRDCGECRRYVIDDRTCRPKLDGDGQPVRLGDNQRRHCELCSRNGWDGFTERNAAAFMCFRTCAEFGVLPRSGGAEDQEPASMETMLALAALKRRIERERDNEERGVEMKAIARMIRG